ncbi:Autophagy-related protein 2 [Wickerhamiella sorbophila]|uniref:Autophagy-related protein 2 n=1 Tax=Wickerhamiella sorbophila TaxID=45607 RepID=A0A2T0FBQ8_9ASCO|nr:Autophagy-related protein 2 [Wickerhamiella sorbophila]PRT52438.1 Autophagy-related protein 2 [Wickerhamiella sorbophila]
MLLPDLGKWVFIYVLDRLKVFSNISPDKLKVSIWKTSSLTLENVDLDTESLAIKGLRVRSASLRAVEMELSTSGIRINGNGADLVVKLGNSYTDLSVSTFFDQTADNLARSVAELAEPNDIADLQDFENIPTGSDAETGYGMGDTTGMVSRLANAILNQLSVNVSNIKIKVLVGEEPAMTVTIDRLYIPRGGKISLSGVVIEQLNDSEPSKDTSSGSVAHAGRGTSSPHNLSDNTSDSSLDDNEYGSMSQSMFFDSNSTFTIAPPAQVLTTITETVESPELLRIEEITIEHTIPFDAVSIKIPDISLVLLPALVSMVKVINEFYDSEYEQDEQSQELKFSLQIDRINVLPEPTSLLQVRLEDLKVTSDKIVLKSVIIPGVHTESPFFVMEWEPVISLCLPHALSIDIAVESLPCIAHLFERMGAALMSIKTPEKPGPTPFDLKMAEIKLVVGELTVMIFPGNIYHESLALEEISLTSASGSRILVQSLDLVFNELSTTINRIQAETTSDFLVDVQAIMDTITQRSISPTNDSPPDISLWVKDVKIHHNSTLWEIPEGLVAKHVSGSWGISANVSCKNEQLNLSTKFSAQSDRNSWEFMAEELTGHLFPAHFQTDLSERENEETVAEAESTSVDYRLKIGGELTVHTPYTCTILFSAKGSGTDRSLRLGTLAKLYLVDPLDTSRIPVASFENAQFSIFWNPLSVKALIEQVSIGACADSFAASSECLEYLVPPASPPKYNFDLNEDINLLTEIDLEAFGQANTTTSSPLSSTSDEFLEQDLEKLVSRMQLTQTVPMNVELVENYVGGQDKTTTTVASKLHEIVISSLSVKLFDGFDFKSTREELREAVERVKQEAEAIIDPELSEKYIGDFMYNSIYIGTKPGFMNDLEGQVDSAIGNQELGRGEKPKVTIAAKQICVSIFSPCEDHGVTVSTTNLSIQDLVVWDHVPTSKWDTLLCIDQKRQRELRVPFIELNIETTVTAAPELRLKARVQPLQISIDQDTLDFLTRYFEFELSAEEPGSRGKKKPDSPPFIQRFELFDLPIVLSYLPKKVDYEGIRSGHTLEFMNLFVIDGSSAVFKHVVVYGQPGYERLAQTLVENWLPDIANTQLADVLGGLSFVSPMIKIGRTIRDMVIIPVRGYSKNGSALIGMHKGAARFAKSTSQQVRKQIRKWLEKTELEAALEEDVVPEQP